MFAKKILKEMKKKSMDESAEVDVWKSNIAIYC